MLAITLHLLLQFSSNDQIWAVEPELKFQATPPGIQSFLAPAPAPTSKRFWLQLQNNLHKSLVPQTGAVAPELKFQAPAPSSKNFGLHHTKLLGFRLHSKTVFNRGPLRLCRGFILWKLTKFHLFVFSYCNLGGLSPPKPSHGDGSAPQPC